MMTVGLVGKKAGMSRYFKQDGTSIPVTVLYAMPNRVMQMKTPSTDKYSALQVTFGVVKPIKLNKAVLAHYAKSGIEPGEGLREFRVPEAELQQYSVGHELSLEQFQVGQRVDVMGISKGKGFAGVIKRHHFAAQDATHGNSLSHRAPGSIGQNQSPGRVFKGKKMAGHLGNVRRTALGLEVIVVDAPQNRILLRGAVPGSTGATVVIRPSVKG